MIDGNIVTLEDKAKITTMMNGKIEYILNSAYVGTVNDGQITKLCDTAKFLHKTMVQ
jgi:hypothetical protein